MNKEYWLATLERAIKTAVQVLIASLSTAAVLEEVNWVGALSATALATLLSLLTSLGSIRLAPGDGPNAFGPERAYPVNNVPEEGDLYLEDDPVDGEGLT